MLLTVSTQHMNMLNYSLKEHVCQIYQSHERTPMGEGPYKPAKEGGGRSFKVFHI